MSNYKIKYIAFYTEDNNQNRQAALSAKNKINYISESLDEYEVLIISPSWTNNSSGLYRGREEKINEKITVKTFLTFGAKSKLGKRIKYFFSLAQLFLYLLIFTKKNETILVYHSILLYYPLKLIKIIKKINLILEVEEIYQDIQILSVREKKNELKFFEIADKYIFSTELLNIKLNKNNKPHIVAYGNYKIEKQIVKKFSDGKIHLVYAGTLDSRKGGACTAVSMCEYLDERYHIHILGFGDEVEKVRIKKLIEKILQKTTCKITYEGVLTGIDYIKFIQSCHAGLSTQKLEGQYNESSFPSKVLSYLSNGLRVISVKIKVLEISEVNELLYFYDSSSPKEIAKKILEIDFTDRYNSYKKIDILDKNFKQKIKNLVNKKYSKE